MRASCSSRASAFCLQYSASASGDTAAATGGSCSAGDAGAWRSCSTSLICRSMNCVASNGRVVRADAARVGLTTTAGVCGRCRK